MKVKSRQREGSELRAYRKAIGSIGRYLIPNLALEERIFKRQRRTTLDVSMFRPVSKLSSFPPRNQLFAIVTVLVRAAVLPFCLTTTMERCNALFTVSVKLSDLPPKCFQLNNRLSRMSRCGGLLSLFSNNITRRSHISEQYCGGLGGSEPPM